MKIGIISANKGVLAETIGLILQKSYETEIFSQDEFKPSMVSEKSLDGLLFEGLEQSSEGFAIAVRRNIPETIKVCYFYCRKPREDLTQYKITAVDMLEPDLTKLESCFAK